MSTPTPTDGKVATTGFDFVMYLVKDMRAAREFYEGVFDLTPSNFDSEHFVEFEMHDGNAFALAVAPEGEGAPSGGLMFAVPDVDAAVERVKAFGGTFYRNYGGDTCDAGWCADPDGNPFGVHKRKTKAA